jgi:hypothetical protein
MGIPHVKGAVFESESGSTHVQIIGQRKASQQLVTRVCNPFHKLRVSYHTDTSEDQMSPIPPSPTTSEDFKRWLLERAK